MSMSIDPAYLYCERIRRNVPLERTEGECREHNNCGEAACPLENKLGHNRFRRALETLAASIGQDWRGAKD